MAQGLKQSFSDFWKKVQNLFQKVWAFFVRMILAIFGSVQWQRPQWIEKLKQKYQQHLQPSLGRLQGRWQNYHQQNQKQVRNTGRIGLVVILLALAGYMWWDHLPKPQQVKVWISEVEPMRLEENSKPYPMYVHFASSVAPLDQVGKAPVGGIDMKPAIEGAWLWTKDSQLQFTPVNDWPVDEEIKISLDKKYFPSHIRLNEYKHVIRTPKFKVLSQSAEFYQHPENPKEKG